MNSPSDIPGDVSPSSGDEPLPATPLTLADFQPPPMLVGLDPQVWLANPCAVPVMAPTLFHAPMGPALAHTHAYFSYSHPHEFFPSTATAVQDCAISSTRSMPLVSRRAPAAVRGHTPRTSFPESRAHSNNVSRDAGSQAGRFRSTAPIPSIPPPARINGSSTPATPAAIPNVVIQACFCGPHHSEFQLARSRILSRLNGDAANLPPDVHPAIAQHTPTASIYEAWGSQLDMNELGRSSGLRLHSTSPRARGRSISPLGSHAGYVKTQLLPQEQSSSSLSPSSKWNPNAQAHPDQADMSPQGTHLRL
jgi:hypothetical protein